MATASRALWLAIVLVPAGFAASIVQPDNALVVHEWGTFTSVAGENGEPVSWAPLSGPSDLPCFVHRLGGRIIKVAASTVRMETPVLYFYAGRPVTLSVHVDFPQGMITEWYPNASRVGPYHADFYSPSRFGTANGSIEWKSVEVLPGEQPTLPFEKAASHYYPARETDAAAVRSGLEQEKLIFYRGIGDFSVPVRPRMTGANKIAIRNADGEAIALVILFENRGGKAGYRLARSLQDSVTLDLPELTGNIDRLRQEIEVALIGAGLYPKEADAMVETWRDFWFEEGTRIFYLVPRSKVDVVLPLTITPTPQQIERVFVGRVEVLAPAAEQDIVAALAGGDVAVLEKYGRFLNPYLSQITAKRGELPKSPRAIAFLQAASIRLQTELSSPACEP
jgi:hypothetical protein